MSKQNQHNTRLAYSAPALLGQSICLLHAPKRLLVSTQPQHNNKPELPVSPQTNHATLKPLPTTAHASAPGQL